MKNMMDFTPGPSQEILPTQEEILDDFLLRLSKTKEYRAKVVSLDQLRELKEKGITTEIFLDHLCQRSGKLLHGSIQEITDNELRPEGNGIFASNKSAIAIMRSLYSNRNVNLEYPYLLSKDNPLVLRVRTPPDGKYISTEKGFVYVVDGAGFVNDPEGSWQFVKKDGGAKVAMVVETEKSDFNYPVEFSDSTGLK